jgi:prepilin-type N-terminal cleavage/methylation domain-containing protein
MRKMNNKKGFSLLEMMITVGIIGILSAIAVPNILVYTARAKQKEGLSLLSTLYGAMRVSRAQLNDYPTDFVAAGYRPEGEIQYRVMIGVANVARSYPSNWYCDVNCWTTAADCDLKRYEELPGARCGAVTAPNNLGDYNAWTEAPQANAAAVAGLAANDCLPNVNNGLMQFRGCAFGDIGGNQRSVISVDQEKNLRIVRDGSSL